MIYLVLILNFAIAWWNCYAIGGIWAESKALGGFARVLAWSGVIQSAIGFSMVFGFLLGGALHMAGLLDRQVAELAASLWYLAVIVPAIGTGLVLTVHSWIVAFRERRLLDLGVASWNTFAQLHNMAGAVDGVPAAIGKFVDALSSDDENPPVVIFAVVLAAGALASGVLLTYVLVQKYAGRLPLPGAGARA